LAWRIEFAEDASLPSIGLAIPLSEIYAFADLPQPGADDPAVSTSG
jgi:hypothetical protein